MVSPIRQHLADCFDSPDLALKIIAALGVSDAALEYADATYGEHVFMVEFAVTACIFEYQLNDLATEVLRAIPPARDLYTKRDAPFFAMMAKMLADLDTVALLRVQQFWMDHLAVRRWPNDIGAWDRYTTALACILLASCDDSVVAAFLQVWEILPERAQRIENQWYDHREAGRPERIVTSIQSFLDLGVHGLRVAKAWFVCDHPLDREPDDIVAWIGRRADQLADDPDLVEYACELAGSHYSDTFTYLLEVAALLRAPVPAETN